MLAGWQQRWGPGSAEALPLAAFCLLAGCPGKVPVAGVGPATEAALPGRQLALKAGKNHLYRLEKVRRLPLGTGCKKATYLLCDPCASHSPSWVLISHLYTGGDGTSRFF